MLAINQFHFSDGFIFALIPQHGFFINQACQYQVIIGIMQSLMAIFYIKNSAIGKKYFSGSNYAV